MALFRFRLQSLLRWRERQAEMAESELHLLIARRDRISSRIHELQQARHEAECGVRDSAEVSAPELAALSTFRRRCVQLEEEQRKSLMECEEEIVQQRRRAVEARRKTRLLERLKERRREEWRLEMDREQERLSSEMQLIRHVRESHQRDL
jgi:flagellar FliJ protein